MTQLAKPILILSLLLILLAGFTTALYYSVTSRIPFGTDSYVFWLAANEVVQDRGNPYSEAVTTEAQLGVYGRAAKPGENYMMFVNPPYSLLPFLPAVGTSYAWAQAYWIALNILSLLVIALAAFPKIPVGAIVTLPFLYPVARGIIMGQYSPSIAGALLIAYALAADRPSRSPKSLFFAGLVLSWVTIKPQLTWVFLLFFLFYGIRMRYWDLFLGFGVGLFGLLMISWVMVPGWPSAWLQQAVAHADNRVLQPGIVLWASWISPATWVNGVAWLLMALAIAATVALFILWRRGRIDILPVFGSVALLSLIVHPLYFPPAQIVLLLPILAWASKDTVRGSTNLKIIWSAALVLPWLIFALTFEGAEPFAISIWTPILYLLWLLFLIANPEPRLGARSRSADVGIILTE